MRIERNDLSEAAARGIIDAQQAERLWAYVAETQRERPGFRPAHVLYYLGGLVAIGAMTLFMTLGWERLGPWGMLAITLGYAALGLVLTHRFLRSRHPIPAGITATFVVALTPLAVYATQSAFGLWPQGFVYRDYHVWIDWRWMVMELATLAAGAVLLWRYRLPFMVMPVAVTLWYMSMDLTPALFGPPEGFDGDYWELRKHLSLWFGLATLAAAVYVDLRARRSRLDYAFWLYLFGVLAFWGGLSLMDSDRELAKFLYCMVNVLMILLGALLGRRVFAVFGALGVAGYLGHLAWRVFADNLLFPFALTAIGLAIIGLGLLWQRREARIQRRLLARLPAALAELIARRLDIERAAPR